MLIFAKARRFAKAWSLALAVACSAAACASVETGNMPPPLIPFQTSFRHWDHHWFLWTPNHPIYESVEVAAATVPTGREVVWVWFTERAAPKKQVHYVNDPQMAFAGEVYVRDIDYHAPGDVGRPRDLTVRFRDKDDAVVEWTVNVDASRDFEPWGAGLTNQSGHSAGALFLVFFREKNVRAIDSRLTIGGHDFSFPKDPSIAARYRFQAAYSSNTFVVVIPYARVRVTTDGSRLTLSSGQTSNLQRHSDVGAVYRTDRVTAGETLTINVDTRGQLLSYEHAHQEHTFRVQFAPALPTATGGRAHYSMSLDRFEGLINGVATVMTDGAGFSVEWNHEMPEWTRGYCFTSKAHSIAPTGYEFVVAPKQR